MRFRFLIFLLFFSGTANSEDAKEQSADSQSKKKGDEIWLEEKISPTTTWIEDLVKPLTTWMEQKINAPEPKSDSQESSQGSVQENTLEPNKTDSDNVTDATSLISVAQASALATHHIAGEVLYIRLMSKTNRYRVKLISKLGEIHIIYVNAISGDIVLRDSKMGIQPVKQIDAEQGSRASSVSESEDERGENP